MPALIGLGTILAASTLVWIISVRLEDASIADALLGLGFVLLVVWLYCLLSPTVRPRSWLVAAYDHAVGRAPLPCTSSGGTTATKRTRATRRCAPRTGGPSGGGASSPSSGCRVRSCGSSRCRCLRGACRTRPPSPRSTAWVSLLLRSDSASRRWVTISSGASGASLPTAERCSTVGCGASRGIRICSETRRCGGASMPSRRQRPADGSPCSARPS